MLLRTQFWPDITQALDAIASGVPDPTIFGPDQSQVDKVTDIVDADKAIKSKLESQFIAYKHDDAIVASLRSNIGELAARFDNVAVATRDELNMPAKGLADVAASDKTTQKDKQQASAVLDSAIKWTAVLKDAIKRTDSLPRPAGAAQYVIL